jgi:integrase
MLAKKPLTDRGIAGLKPAAPRKRKLYWDAVVPGLAVRVTDTGAKAYVLVGRFPGNPNPTARSIGRVGAISLEAARVVAREWLAIMRAGRDPAREAAKAAADTLKAICEEYQAREGHKLRSAEWRQSVLARLVYPRLGSTPIVEIRRSDVVRLLDRISDENGPVIANRTLGLLSRIFSWHAKRSDNFSSPIVRGMATAEQARDRVLSDDEIRAVWKATDPTSLLHRAFTAYIRFLLLTAARRTEAAELRWGEIAEGVWTLPAARNKVGQELIRPLSRAAQAIVDGQPRVGEFVFSRNGRTALANFTKPKAKLDAASGTSGWTLHDIRRTSRSLLSRAGVPSDHAERCLGHVIGGVRGTYDRHEYYEEKRLAFEALAALIGRIVDPQPNVVAIHRS